VHRFVELFIALRYLRPRRSYVSAITVLSLLGVMCGVAVLIIVLSVMEGFERELRDKVVGFNAHVTVSSQSVMQGWRETAGLLARQPGVQAVTPFVTGPVLLEINHKISTPYLRGLDDSTAEQVIPMKKSLVAGEWLSGPGGILVGEQWARTYNAWIGDKVLIHSPRNIALLRSPSKNGPQEFYLPDEYRIVGIFSTGFFEYDFNFVLVSLGEAQRLYGMGDGVHGLMIRTGDPMQAGEVKVSVNKLLHRPLQAMTWMDQNKRLFGAVAVERRVMSFLLFFVMIVAAFGLSSTLITVTVQKAGEIGLMKAVGAGDGQIVAIFTLYGLVIGLLGSTLGVAGGMLTLVFRNDFSNWLNHTFKIEVFPADIYNFDSIPAVTDGWTIFWIALAGVLLSTAAALIPAFAALRVDPVVALHSE